MNNERDAVSQGNITRKEKRGTKIDVEACERILLDIKEILDGAGIPFWLAFGTFLGIYRDKGLIPWDNDIDLAVYAEDNGNIIGCNGKFIERGFKLRDCKTMMTLYRDGEHADLCLFQCSGNERIYERRRYPISAFETPNWVEFLGQKWRIFTDPEKWLYYIYGPNWRIPDKMAKKGQIFPI